MQTLSKEGWAAQLHLKEGTAIATDWVARYGYAVQDQAAPSAMLLTDDDAVPATCARVMAVYF